MGKPSKFRNLWMRPVSFAGLLRILHITAEFPNGLRASELDNEILKREAYLTREGFLPARATLYHCRNTLLRIEALKKEGMLYLVNEAEPKVEILMGEKVFSNGLSEKARDAFSELVIRNADCKKNFFDMFMKSRSEYGEKDFRELGTPVKWGREDEPADRLIIVFEDMGGDRLRTINHYNESRSILYGVRYWARDELSLIDEIVESGDGTIMYPIFRDVEGMSVSALISVILKYGDKDGDWVTVSIRDVALRYCIKARRPLRYLFEGIDELSKGYPGYVTLAPTAQDFASIGAGSTPQEDFELRRYYQDQEGRYISHLSIYKSLAEVVI